MSDANSGPEALVIVEGAAGRVAVPESAALAEWEPRGYEIVAKLDGKVERDYRHPNHYQEPLAIPTGDSHTDIEIAKRTQQTATATTTATPTTTTTAPPDRSKE